MNNKISVAMATYNGAIYIQKQLETIASQIYLPYELVVCDDGSTDNTEEIIKNFSLTSKFPVHFHKNENNLGFANNFLKAASLCKGDWISFCDQDDIWMPNKLLKINRVINGATADLVLVYHAADLVNDKLELLGRRLPVINSESVLPARSHSCFWFVGGCVMCFKSELLDGIDSIKRPRDNYKQNIGSGIDSYPWMPHDKWVCMLANMCGEIASVSEVLSLYRRHDYALTGAHAEQSAGSKIVKISETGAGEYLYLSSFAHEMALAIQSLSNKISNETKRKKLICGAQAWTEISKSYGKRSEIYSNKFISLRFVVLIKIIISGSYLCSNFTSLGWRALIKDVLYVVGVFKLINLIIKKFSKN